MDSAAIVKQLALLEQECETCAQIDDREGWGRGCPECHGDQKVPLIPGLRRECRGCHGKGYRDLNVLPWPIRVGCSDCGGKGREGYDNMVNGLGWLPLDVPQAAWVLMRFLLEHAWDIEFGSETLNLESPLDDGMLMVQGEMDSMYPMETFIQAAGRALLPVEVMAE